MPMPNFRAVNMLAPVPVKAANVVAPARGALCGTPVQRPMGETGSGGAKTQTNLRVSARPRRTNWLSRVRYPQLDDSLKVSETAEYFLFVRKRSDTEDEPGRCVPQRNHANPHTVRWLPLGDITIDKDAKVEAAVKE
eukprot:4109688-Pyramimonas_sp.AAC.2